MTKRFFLFLALAFLVLLLWRPGARPSGTRGAAPDEVPPPPTAPEAPADDEPGAARPVEEAEPWRETLLLGRGAQHGRYQATFDNAGARLVELRLEDYVVDHRLAGAERDDPANWVPLLTEVENRRGVPRPDDGVKGLGSLALSAAPALIEAGLVQAPLESVRWQHERIEEDGATLGVRFTHTTGTGLRFEKTVRVVPGTYDLALELTLSNEDAALAGRKLSFVLTPAMGVPRSSEDQFTRAPKAEAAWLSKKEVKLARQERIYDELREGTFPPQQDLLWVGVDSKYFAVLLRPTGPEAADALVGAGWRTVFDEAWAREHREQKDDGYRHIAADVDLLVRVPEAGASTRLDYRLYAGPKDRPTMERHEESMGELVRHDLGFFRSIATLLLTILGLFHSLLGNWGWAIVLLTLFVRAALFPFNRRSQTAMARHATKMKRVQPKLNEVKERYKSNPQKLRQEQARIMQEEGAFPPLGGCLPIFVQIPIFFGLFSALRASFDLRQAPFLLWMQDLSLPDRMMRLDLSLPLIGTVEYLNVLPPLMVVMWIAQQKVMPKPTDEQAARMQKMMMWMPILFGIFLYNYPAGLSLYMITTSTFSILEQTVIKRIWPIDDREQPKKKSGFMARMAELSKEAQKLQEMKRREQGQRSAKKGGKGPKGKAKGRR